ncbi:MAG: SusD/RagB family nutrient-binding outer membrane lipoprotein [Cyclobacteriaceae bacterium]|nr:SusD/RagB family nutrient-binding outer membrane lipoprotein [Cyclobacteriaceae bacterium]
MKKLYKYIVLMLIGFSVLILPGCNDWLDINEDPNNPTDVPLNQILPTIQVDVAGAVGMSVGGLSHFTSLYTHQITERGNSQNDYAFNGSDFGVTIPWSLFYPRALTDISKVIEKGTEQEAWHYVGVAQILQAFIYSVLVDMYGDVPFYEANLGAEQPFPAYDDGEAVYNEVLTLLDEGIANLAKESTLTPLNDDLFYGGGDSAMDRWRKFAKTLKLKLYNQARLAWDVSGDVSALISEGDLIGPGEDFEFQYGTSAAPDNRNPAYTQEYTPGAAFYYVSPYFYEIMTGQNSFFPVEGNPYLTVTDPRVPYYFYNQLEPGEAAENPTSYKDGEFVSIYAFSFNIDPNEGFDQASSKSVLGLYPIGGRYDDGEGGIADFNGAASTPQRILTYFQRKFIEAELALTGETSGNARDLFEEALQASFDKVNEVAAAAGSPEMDETEVDDYISFILDAWDTGNDNIKMKQLMTQKWIASFGYAVDIYTDYRRTGYPQLHDGNTDNLNVTSRTRDYPLAYPWVTDNLEINPNAPAQKNVSNYRVFWDAN